MRLKLVWSVVVVAGLMVVANSPWKSSAVPTISELGNRGVVTKGVPLTLRTGLPVVPKTQRLYRLAKSNPRSASEVEKASFALGMTGKATEVGGQYQVIDGGRSLTDYGSAMWFVDEQNFAMAQKRPGLQNESSGRVAADKVVSQFLPANVSVSSVEYHQGTATVGDASGNQETFPIGHEFRYKLNVAGVPVVGPGAQVRIYIGEDNKVDAMYLAIPTLQASREIPVITPSEALDRLQKRGITSVQVAERAEITTFELAYYVPPANVPVSDQDSLIQPVYVMQVQVSHGGTVETVVEYVQAAENVE